MPTTSFIEKNRVTTTKKTFRHTAMVSHRGVPISFGMTTAGRIFYSVLDLSSSQGSSEPTGNDARAWSSLREGTPTASVLRFPRELSQVGYGVVPNRQIEAFDGDNRRVIARMDANGRPVDAKGTVLTKEAIEKATDAHYSSTARLGAVAPFQALSDGKYVYLFRQAISADDTSNTTPPMVDDTLLVDRFILSGVVLKPSREVRYQRSRHKTEPASRKDTLSAVDMDGKPFYEPTRELVFANHLTNGNFTVLLIPGADSEEHRWQIFAVDRLSGKVNSFNVRFDPGLVFDLSDSEQFVQRFLERYALDSSLIADTQAELRAGRTDPQETARTLLGRPPYSTKDIPEDALAELVYTLRTGVIKDDFRPTSTSEWPLMEYDGRGAIKSRYLVGGVLDPAYRFKGEKNALAPLDKPHHIRNGLSACYYYGQEMGPDNKPIKNKASVMLAMGLEDDRGDKYIGLLNFSVAEGGRNSRLSTDNVNLPDINVQALDENPYRDLAAIERVRWQDAQKMHLVDIDPDGLSTSGGVLRFAYTSSDFASQYSDAVEADSPTLFDDSLGRVNLYFKGKNDNFFVLYFNPHGSKGVDVTHGGAPATPPIVLAPRLDRDMTIDVVTTVSANTADIRMRSGGATVEHWRHLPRQLGQLAGTLNGQASLPLARLEPLGDPSNPRLAYRKGTSGNGTLRIRTTVDNTLVFKDNALAASLADGATHRVSLSALSPYLHNNPDLRVAKKSFSLAAEAQVSVETSLFYKSHLAALVDEAGDIDRLWTFLHTEGLVLPRSVSADRGHLRAPALTQTAAALANRMTDSKLEALSLQLLGIGNAADKSARLARLRLELVTLIREMADVRLLTFCVRDTNAQSVDGLDAGLSIESLYDYATNYACTPGNLGGHSAPEWTHARSYLFKVKAGFEGDADATTEIDASFRYRYAIHNTIGQWEDWDASLAVEFTPQSASRGALLTTHAADKLQQLRPSEHGLSAEAWVKPAADLSHAGRVLYFKQGEHHYGLGVEQDSTNPSNYRAIVTLGDTKYTSADSFGLASDGRAYWRHLAFTHKKHWGYRLGAGTDVVSCGIDDSLSMQGEHTIEVLARIDQLGTLVQRAGEYRLAVVDVNGAKEVVFEWGNGDAKVNALETWKDIQGSLTTAQRNDPANYRTVDGKSQRRSRPEALRGLGRFYKFTLIRSKDKPLTTPSATDYPLTGGSTSGTQGTGKKWYEDKSGDALIKGMAERQDQLGSQVDAAQGNLFGDDPAAGSDTDFKHYYTLIVQDGLGRTWEWTSGEPIEVDALSVHNTFTIGGGGFTGTLASTRFWARALSKREAKANTLPDNKAGLVSHWRVAEGKDRYLYDNIGDNHGTAPTGAASAGTAGSSGWTHSPQPQLPGLLDLYVDGTLVNTTTATGQSVVGTDQLSLGGVQTSTGTTDHFKGVLEEVRIWNQPRTAEQISDNAFGRLKGELDQLLANYTFDRPMSGDATSGYTIHDASPTTAQLTVEGPSHLREILSTAPVATEVPQVRSALTGVVTDYNGTIRSRPSVVEYGDVQVNDDGTINGILKRCYAFVDSEGVWNRVTGYKVGNLVSQWFGQAQFAPQVIGYLEGPPPLPGENFPIGHDGDINIYAYKLDNSVTFRQAEEVSYNYSTSKEAGWDVAVTSELKAGIGTRVLTAPLGFGFSFKVKAGVAAGSNWQTSGSRSQSYERGVSVNTGRSLSAAQAGYDNGKTGAERFYKLGNTGYALVMVALMMLAENRGHEVTARAGILWGIAGFITVHFAPGLTLAPEVPGVAAADVGPRQIWWTTTVATAGIAMWLIAFGGNLVSYVIAALLLMAPHLIGAPEPDSFAGPVPTEIGALFAARAFGIGMAAWVLLGAFAGHFWQAEGARSEAAA